MTQTTEDPYPIKADYLSAPIPLDEAQGAPIQGTPETIAQINARFSRGTVRMIALAEELQRNTEATQQNGVAISETNEMTREMYEAWVMAKTGIETIAKVGRALAAIGKWLARAVKWIAPVIVGIVGIYQAVDVLWRTGPPK
jgi:hypothetical protein